MMAARAGSWGEVGGQFGFDEGGAIQFDEPGIAQVLHRVPGVSDGQYVCGQCWRSQQRNEKASGNRMPPEGTSKSRRQHIGAPRN